MSSNVKIHPADQRRQPRIILPEPAAVLDAHSGEILGQIVNLSTDGLMLAGPVHISAGTVRQLRIQVQQQERNTELLVGVESLWCQDDNNSGTYWTGFQIIDISTEHQQTLDMLTAE